MTTIRTVAKLAGVSTGTVSNVLSGNRPVSNEVRQRVLQAIEELDYQPNMMASGLVTGRSKTISAVMSNYQLGLGNLLAGMDTGAREEGFSLLISRLGNGEEPVKHLQSLKSRGVDGLIWVIPETEQSHRWWETMEIVPNIPIVFAFGSSHLQQSSVCMDNFSGGYAATRHLIEHGCRKIGHIAGPKDSFEARERKAGWEKALRDEGIEPNMVCEGDWYAEEKVDCIYQMLEQWPDLEALFVVSDNCALAAIKVLQNNNLRVPEDIKVIGFDDIRFLDYANPPLTSVRQDYFRMGQHAAKEVLRRIQHPESKAKVEVIPTELIVRRSCGCDYG